jgi:hypothetical protein
MWAGPRPRFHNWLAGRGSAAVRWPVMSDRTGPTGAHASRLGALRASVSVAGAVLAYYGLRWASGEPAHLPLEQASIALSLTTGHGFSSPFWHPSGPTAWAAPSVPFLYAGAVLVSVRTGLSPLQLYVGLSTVMVAAATWLVLRHVLLGWGKLPRAVFCAAFAVYGAADGDFLSCPGALISLELAALLAGLCSVARDPLRPGPVALLTLALAALCLTHPGLAMAGIAASLLIGFIPSLPRREVARAGVVAGVIAVAVGVLPWAVRNHRVFGKWLPGKSNGAFELVLAHDYTDDGELTASALLAGNPSTNPRLNALFCQVGEARFLEPYAARARAILTGETLHYLRNCYHRLASALVYSDPSSDTGNMGVVLEPNAAWRLVGKGALFYLRQDEHSGSFLWASPGLSRDERRAVLVGAGVTQVDAALADWDRSLADVARARRAAGTVLLGLLWSGIPSLVLLASVAYARRNLPGVVVTGGVVYLVALVPNILITHDIAHQHDFAVVFSLAFAGLFEGIRRRHQMLPSG